MRISIRLKASVALSEKKKRKKRRIIVASSFRATNEIFFFRKKEETEKEKKKRNTKGKGEVLSLIPYILHVALELSFRSFRQKKQQFERKAVNSLCKVNVLSLKREREKNERKGREENKKKKEAVKPFFTKCFAKALVSHSVYVFCSLKRYLAQYRSTWKET